MDLPVLNLASCDGCGACCRTVSAPPFRIDHVINEPRARGVPQEMIDDFLPAWEIRLQVDASPCLWFDESSLRCRHYEFRPAACRDFEINSSSCAAVRDYIGVPEDEGPAGHDA